MRGLPILVFAVATVVGCSDNPAAPHSATGAGQLALLNALAAGDPATVKIDGAAMALPPAGASGTAELAAGPHELRVVANGQTIASSTFTLTDGGHRTAVVSGGTGHIVLLVTTLDTAAAPVTDAAKMRLVHTVSDAPPMDSYLFLTTQAADSSARFVIPFNYGSGTDPEFPGYAVRPPGSYLVWLKAAGTDDVLVQGGPFTVNAGEVYSFVLARNDAGNMEIRAVREH